MFKKIGIVGYGMVGGATMRYFAKKKYEVIVYDKYKKIGNIEEVNKTDIIFVCVPTPVTNNGYDLTAIHDVLSKIEFGKIVILKSTVLPGTTFKLQKQYTDLVLLFNPEFLTEKTCDEDFRKPDSQIIGYSQKVDSFKVATKILNLLPDAPFKKIMPASNAEAIKLVRNVFFASKVIIFNEIYDTLSDIGVNYDNIKDAIYACKMIAPYHLEIFHQGGRGAGGKCLTKDLKAFIQLGTRKRKLFKLIDKINNKLLTATNKK